MSQLTLAQRYKLEYALEKGISKPKIANDLGVHRSTVYREINRFPKKYGAERAHFDYLSNKKKRIAYAISDKHKSIIASLLAEYLSPEQIVNRCRKENIDFPCVETIYRYIYFDKRNNGKLYTYLRRKRKHRKRRLAIDMRGVLSNRTLIHLRPTEADRRTEVGHFELDCVIGTKSQAKVLVTAVDRCARYSLIGLADNKSEAQVFIALQEMFNRSIIPVKTLRCDNGKEFACHEKLETTLCCPVYFADPYASWQRGTNENTNGLIRQFFPKGKCLNKTTLEHVNHVENFLNTRPRKVLDYYSPEEKLHNQLIPIIGSRKCCI